MPNAWGKIVKNLRIHSWFVVDDYPQNLRIVFSTRTHHVHNYPQILIFLTVSTRTFPHDFLHSILPLRHLFSPLSTPPITISTNL